MSQPTHEEVVLNKLLSPYNLSLNSTIDDVLNMLKDEVSLDRERIERIKINPDNWKTSLYIWIDELEGKVTRNSNNIKRGYDAIQLTAYENANSFKRGTQVETIYGTNKLSAYHGSLYEQHLRQMPDMTPANHIRHCLISIATGVYLTDFLPKLKRELNDLEPERVFVGSERNNPEDIITTSKVDMFRKMEQRLFSLGYLDGNRKWLKTKRELAGFYFFLTQGKKSYFKSTISSKKQKDFICTRYRSAITKEFQPGEIKNKASSETFHRFNQFLKQSD